MAKKWLGTPTDCGFCNKPIPPNTPYKYCYPIPKPYLSHNFEGRICCPDCWPEIRQAQLDQGLVEEVFARTAHA